LHRAIKCWRFGSECEAYEQKSQWNSVRGGETSQYGHYLQDQRVRSYPSAQYSCATSLMDHCTSKTMVLVPPEAYTMVRGNLRRPNEFILHIHHVEYGTADQILPRDDLFHAPEDVSRRTQGKHLKLMYSLSLNTVNLSPYSACFHLLYQRLNVPPLTKLCHQRARLWLLIWVMFCSPRSHLTMAKSQVMEV